MRILIGGMERTVGQAFLLLTVDEAAQLEHELRQLLSRPDYDHGDVVDPESGHMVTVALYGPDAQTVLTDRLRRAVERDE